MDSVSENEALAAAIVRKLQQSGFIAYWAGGCVRDRLMGAVPQDYDVATSARPEEVRAIYPRSQMVGAAFGVVLVREKKTQVEVATFRTDGSYSDGRRPDSVTYTTAQIDAQRRDFTCNGLFFDPVANQLHDFVGGQADIEAKILRAIGDPERRFAEDHLRMLRAVRFAAKLRFSLDAATLTAIQRHAAEILTVSHERIHDELEMILLHPTRAAGAELLRETGLLAHLWPSELRSGIAPSWNSICCLPPEADFTTATAALEHDMTGSLADGPAAALLRRDWLLSNVETEDIAWLLRHRSDLLGWRSLTKAKFKRLLADPRWPRLAMLHRTYGRDFSLFDDRVRQLQAEGVAPEPFVTGDDLISLGASPGPTFKRWLESLYDRQLEGEFASRDPALAAARLLLTNA